MSGVEIPESVDDMAPYTPFEIEVLQRKINKRLMQINKAQRDNNKSWSAAKAALGAKRERAIWESFEARPDAPKWVHEAFADAQAADEKVAEFYWERQVRSHNDEAHNLRQIQSSLQTLYKGIADESGLRR